ncbi:MAG TPA: hypothetical protein VEC11_10640 [Allosphingosinicella sp.]|nr:hypothetical protein [Allosphingosinicella sp.]
MARPASDRFETVAFVYNPSDLALLLSRFGHANIHVQPISLGHAAADPTIVTALGGVALRVHAEEAAEARALLGELERIPYREPLFVGFLLVFLVLALFGIGSPPRQIPTFLTGELAARADP